MRLTKRLAVLAGAVAVVGSLAFAAPAVAADPGYPGTTTTTTSGPITVPPGIGSILGCTGGTVTIAVGQTLTVNLTGCAPGTAFSITINGVSASLTVTSDGSGHITLVIAVTDPHISVNGSTPVPSVFGTNAVVLTPASGPATTVNVIIPSSATAAATGSSSAGSSGSAGGASSGSSGGTVATSSGSLAFTGADIAATVVGGIALLAIGTLLVVFTRRRASHQRV